MNARTIYYERTVNGYELTFAFDQSIVHAIKTTVGRVHRSYDGGSRTWTLTRQTDFERLRTTLSDVVFERVKVNDEDHTPPGWKPGQHKDPFARVNDPRRNRR
jgi:hypothetical protein